MPPYGLVKNHFVKTLAARGVTIIADPVGSDALIAPRSADGTISASDFKVGAWRRHVGMPPYGVVK